MAKYLILNLIVTVIVVVFFVMMNIKKLRIIVFTMTVLVLLTAVFDSLIIWARIVAYNENVILGLRIGKAPIEDFFYCIVAALAIPAIWQILGRDNE